MISNCFVFSSTCEMHLFRGVTVITLVVLYVISLVLLWNPISLNRTGTLCFDRGDV